jgi:DNA polymerase III subunit epsilon
MDSISMPLKSRSLKLERPLAFIDLETTGTAVEFDRIVELGILKITPEGKEFLFCERLNPGIRIPIEATDVHGIADKDVVGKPCFRQVAKRLLKFLDNCDLGGFNINSFDLPLLRMEFSRIGVEFPPESCRIVDVMDIFHLKEPRDLCAAHRFYCGSDHEHAHSALGDAQACWRVLQGQLERYSDLPVTPEELAKFVGGLRKNRFLDSGYWFEQRHGKPAFAKGKHRGKLLSDVCEAEPDYIEWLLQLPDLPKDSSVLIRRECR